MFCISIIAKNTEEALEKMAKADTLGSGDIFEIRLDLMEDFDLSRIIGSSPKPVLVTYRTVPEGGKGRADPKTVTDVLLTAIREGTPFVDVEYRLPSKWRRKILDARGASRIIISMHQHDGTPEASQLIKLLDDCASTGADIVKIVTRAETWADNLRVLELIPMAHDRGLKIIAFCMGPMGRVSRILSHLMGGYLTFVSLEKGQESAAGQIPMMEMENLLEYFSK